MSANNWQPTGNIKGPAGAGSIVKAITPLVSGQSFITVVFESAQADALWRIEDFQIVNTTDSAPLNISTGILTAKSTTGFTLQLNGAPDSANYFLHWSINVTPVPPVPATTYVLTGPSTGTVGVASLPFTVHLLAGNTVAAPVTITPHVIGIAGGTVVPSTVVLTTAAPSATFIYTPAAAGSKSITTTNDGGLTDPAALPYNVAPGPLVDGDTIYAWPDSSGNGHNGNKTGTPIYKVNIINGKPVVRLRSASLDGFNLVTPIPVGAILEMFVVMKPATPAGQLYSLTVGATGAKVSFVYGITEVPDTGSGSLIAMGALDTSVYISPNAYNNAFHLFNVSISSGGGGISVDGNGLSATPFASVNTGQFLSIGFQGAVFSDGDLAEIIMFSRLLDNTTTFERQGITQYALLKYALGSISYPAIDPSAMAGLVGWWKADALH